MNNPSYTRFDNSSQEFEQAYEHWRGTLANKPKRRSPSDMSQWAAAIWPGWGGS